MKKVLVVLLCLGNQLYAQEYSRTFGVISDAEWELTEYKDAPEALILYDVGHTTFDIEKSIKIDFERARRIKILDKAGINQAEIAIPFYVKEDGEKERIYELEAYTYNRKNGQIVKKRVNPEDIFEEQINQNWRVKKFVFPEVEPGSIVEYKYRHSSPFLFNIPDWEFQSEVPTVYSEYKANMIPFYEYVNLIQGVDKFDSNTVVNGDELRKFGMLYDGTGREMGPVSTFYDKIFTYVMKDTPPFKDESFITTREDHIMKMDFQLAEFHNPFGDTEEIITTWSEMIKELLENESFGGFMEDFKSSFKKIQKSGSVDLDNLSENEKIKAIINYVKDNFDWNGNYGKFASKTAKEFFSQKAGNSAEINLFLTAFLRHAEIDAYPVILSTRKNGKIAANYPFSHFFNYVVVYVKGKEQSFLSDATEGILPYNKIPIRCINGKGFVIQKGLKGWVPLSNNKVSRENRTITITIDPEQGLIESGVTIQATEYLGYNYRKILGEDVGKIESVFLENGFNKVENIKTINYAKNTQPYVIAFVGESELESLGDKLVVSPFLKFPLQENKLKQKSRSYPVDFIYKKTESMKSQIAIPSGFKLSNQPENYLVNDDLISISVTFDTSDNSILANATYTFKKEIYPPEDYNALKDHIDKIVEKFNQQLLLEKI